MVRCWLCACLAGMAICLTQGCGGSSSPAPKPKGWQPESTGSAGTESLPAPKPEGWKPAAASTVNP